MKIIGIFVLLFLFVYMHGQKQLFPFDDESRYVDNTTPFREINDAGVDGLNVKYTFSGVWINQHILDSGIFSSLKIDNFSNLQIPGLPALPSHIDLIAVPTGSNANLSVINNQVDIYPNFRVLPATLPIKDIPGALYPNAIPDYAFYSTSSVYPANPISIKGMIHIKGMDIIMVEVCPVQYNPATKVLYVHKNLEYHIGFSSNPTEFISKNKYSFDYLNQLPDLVINNDYLRQEIDHYISLNINSRIDSSNNYIIFTNNSLKPAAERLALWKSQLGFRTIVICDNNWTSSKIKNKINSLYGIGYIRPDYLLFLGDNSIVPPEIFHDSTGNITSTDLYYGCLDGSGDIYPELSIGRISVINNQQADKAVANIINYESNPDTNNFAFFNSACFISSFNQVSSGVANRMFAWSTEKSAKFLENLNKDINRNYFADNSTNPLIWENKYFNSGEQIPNYLKKPLFPWNASYSGINNTINNGVNLIYYRGAGYSGGLVSPFYKSAYLIDIHNENSLPLFINLSSYGGKFTDGECFTEKIQRMSSGGMIGIFAHNSLSYSGYSDALGIAMIDALTGSPALLSNFTDLQTNVFPLAEHKSIETLGYLHLHSLVKTIEFWGGTHDYLSKTNESFQLFADPSIKIWNEVPGNLTASYLDTIHCYSDSILLVSNLISGSQVTLMNGKNLICKRTAVLDTVVLRLGHINSENLIVTISKPRYKPIVDTLIVNGNCNSANFKISSSGFCIDDSINIIDASNGLITSYQWTFGTDASISSSQSTGPFYIKYSTAGEKIISLTTTGATGSLSIYSEKIYISSDCKNRMPVSGNQIITKCSGILTDDGGDQSDYSDNMESSTLISPLGCSYLSLQFTSFKTNSNADVISIYDGSSKNDVLIGEFYGNNLPLNGNVFYTTKSSILIVQKTDANNSESGFELKWQCFNTSNTPSADFTSFDSISCDGYVHFINQSQNVSSVIWDFGDGSFSNDLNPEHQYSNSGLYSIKLKTTNSYGSDSLIKHSFVNVSLPQNPIPIHSKRCKDGTFQLSANHPVNGKLYWFESMQSTNLLFRGDTFNTPHLHQSKTYYTELHSNSTPEFTGLPNHNGTGSYFTANYINYLIFDSYKEFILKSVKVYSAVTAYRTFLLLNSSDLVLESKTVLIPAGEHRVLLDFDIPLGTNLKLAVNQNNNLYFNDGIINYPFELAGVVKIKSSNNHINPLGAYYFCYDWEIYYDECISSRVAINAEIIDTLMPEVTVSIVNSDPMIEFINNTKYASSYYWSFGDGDFSLQKSPKHTYLNNGLYTITLICSNECGNSVYTDQILINSSSLDASKNELKFNLLPNPAVDQITISFHDNVNDKIEIEIYNALGSKISNYNFNDLGTENSIRIDIKSFKSGVYYLKIKSGKFQTIEKLLVY